ncbi:glucitol operon GutQ protein [Klebsiella pneumoniae]|uniref:Glucitol operon GutQ protein n=1 Tax=Klebsiella pneumoniae TaxID=573 RepID=A0A377U2Y5_KLEPN|nr:glucitol operon GutQ protein [Klebsiella pneumoniae]
MSCRRRAACRSAWATTSSRAAETIIHCEGKLIVSGIGKSGHIGKKLAATFASTGTPAFFVHPAEALHGDLGMLDSRDVMLFISYSGSAKELDLIVPRLEEKGIPLLAMTGKSTSPLALAAKAVLDIAVEREACPMHLAPNLQHRQHADAGRRVGDGGDAGARFQ